MVWWIFVDLFSFLWRGEWSVWRLFCFPENSGGGGLLWIYAESLFSVGEVGLCQRLRILSASDGQRLEFRRGIVLKKGLLVGRFFENRRRNGLTFRDWAGNRGVLVFGMAGGNREVFVLLVGGRRDWMSGWVCGFGIFLARMGCKRASVFVGSKRLENDIDYQLVLEGASRLSSAAGLPQLSISGSGFVAWFSLDAG